jgi:hypothetical protein
MRTRPVRSTLTAALFAIASTLPISALAVYEAEPNDSYNAPQRLVIGSDGKAMVSGSIGDPSGTPLVNDVDFYTFEGRQNDRVTIDIDGGIKGGAGGSDVDTYLSLFAPNSMLIHENESGPRPPESDGGSLSEMDARLEVVLPMDGTYTLAVTASFMIFFDGGVLVDGTTANSNGSYTLLLSGVTPPASPTPTPPPAPSVQGINIDIKPHDRGRAHINPKARGTIPVALLSSKDFNPLEVEHASVTFGSTGTETKAIRCGSDKHRRHDRDQWDDDDDGDRHGRHGRHHKKSRHDFNDDGRPDLVCRFENRDAGFELGDVEGFVKGRTTSGKPFEGRGTLKVYPARRDLDRRHHNHHRR